MKKLRQLAICLLLSGIVLCACDNSLEVLKNLNEGPSFLFNGQAIDLLEDSIKFNLGGYGIPVIVSDVNDNIASLEYKVTNGSGVITKDGGTLGGNQIPLKDFNKSDLVFEPGGIGFHRVELMAIDDFGETASMALEVHVFYNINPVARVEIIKPPNTGPFEREIDASQSIDGDQEYGGGIVLYEYIFLGIRVETDKSKQTVIFPDNGSYQIVVRVKDNDGVWSDQVSLQVII